MFLSLDVYMSLQGDRKDQSHQDGTYCLNDPNRYTYYAVFKKSFAICFGFCTFMLPCRLELPHGHQVVALFQRVDTSEHYSHHPHITTSRKCSGHTSPPFALAPGYHSPQCGLENFSGSTFSCREFLGPVFQSDRND